MRKVSGVGDLQAGAALIKALVQYLRQAGCCDNAQDAQEPRRGPQQIIKVILRGFFTIGRFPGRLIDISLEMSQMLFDIFQAVVNGLQPDSKGRVIRGCAQRVHGLMEIICCFLEVFHRALEFSVQTGLARYRCGQQDHHRQNQDAQDGQGDVVYGTIKTLAIPFHLHISPSHIATFIVPFPVRLLPGAGLFWGRREKSEACVIGVRRYGPGMMLLSFFLHTLYLFYSSMTFCIVLIKITLFNN
jgi:hypothetical protein